MDVVLIKKKNNWKTFSFLKGNPSHRHLQPPCVSIWRNQLSRVLRLTPCQGRAARVFIPLYNLCASWLPYPRRVKSFVFSTLKLSWLPSPHQSWVTCFISSSVLVSSSPLVRAGLLFSIQVVSEARSSIEHPPCTSCLRRPLVAQRPCFLCLTLHCPLLLHSCRHSLVLFLSKGDSDVVYGLLVTHLVAILRSNLLD